MSDICKADKKPLSPCCPICQETFALASMTSCCYTSFCYPCIRSWLQKHSETGSHASCPTCRAPLTLKELCPNPALDDMVEAFGLLQPERAKEMEAFRKMRAEDKASIGQIATQASMAATPSIQTPLNEPIGAVDIVVGSGADGCTTYAARSHTWSGYL